MRKLVALFTLVLLSFIGAAQAADFSPSVIIDRVSNSIVRVQTKRVNAIAPEPMTGYSGSGFIVASDEKETIVATAKHVVDDPQATFFTVLLGDSPRITTFCTKIDGVDAAYLTFRPGIKGAKALDFNLGSDDGVVDAVCFGYAQLIHLRDETPKPTFTVGKLSRKVSERMGYGGGEVVSGIIYGTATLLFGYSGGVCVDLDYHILGINVAIGREMTMFIDGRVLWNNIPELNKGKLSAVPYDPTFHISNTIGETRIAEGKDATITLQDGTHPLGEYFKQLLGTVVQAMDPRESALAEITGAPLPLPDSGKVWVKSDTYFTINHKKYVIYYVQISVAGYQGYRNRMAFREDEKHYIYLCDRGWELGITLDEVDDAVINKINEAWKTAKTIPAVK